MAHDEGMAQILRDALTDQAGITEKKMFGGLCFLLNGNMLIGLHGEKAGGGAMFRVGPDQEAAALAIPGTKHMEMTGRRMTGFIDLEPEGLEDDDSVAALLALALSFVTAMPPK